MITLRATIRQRTFDVARVHRNGTSVPLSTLKQMCRRVVASVERGADFLCLLACPSYFRGCNDILHLNT